MAPGIRTPALPTVIWYIFCWSDCGFRCDMLGKVISTDEVKGLGAMMPVLWGMHLSLATKVVTIVTIGPPPITLMLSVESIPTILTVPGRGGWGQRLNYWATMLKQATCMDPRQSARKMDLRWSARMTDLLQCTSMTTWWCLYGLGAPCTFGQSSAGEIFVDFSCLCDVSLTSSNTLITLGWQVVEIMAKLWS